MARAVEQIRRDIAALEQAVQAIACEFDDLYGQYLTALGQVVRQQLVLASYHLCTQGYPDRFLKLSFAQRQSLQQSLRNLGKETQLQLDDLLQPSQPGSELAKPDAAFDGEPTQLPHDGVESSEIEQATVPLDELDQLDPLDQLDQLGSDDDGSEDGDFSEDDDFIDDLTLAQEVSPQPQVLLEWQERVERSIIGTLQIASHAANRLLQKANILPAKLPDPILEVAAKAGSVVEGSANVPNLLNLLVETQSEEDEEASVTHVVAIHLRLTEIEFNNTSVSALRAKIRGLSARLSQLGRDYQKKQRERAIAEAEAAWRSSWYEE